MNVQQNIILENGATIWLPPSPTYPNVAIPDLSKPNGNQLYDVGTAYLHNGKCYYYAYCTAAVKSRMAAECSYDQTLSLRACPTSTAIYGTEIYVTTVSPDGPSDDGTFAKDYMKGGHVTVFVEGSGTPDDDDFSRGIIGSSVVTSPGSMKLTLDAPIPHATVQGTTIIEATASPYAAIKTGARVSYPKVGLPACVAAATQWVWVQTWGICWIAPQTGVGVAGDIGVVFRHDGSLEPALTTVTEYISNQLAGYAVTGLVAETQSAPFIFLQIAHP